MSIDGGGLEVSSDDGDLEFEIRGRLSVVGEYNAATIDRLGANSVDFTSWSVEATWSLSQVSRASAYRMSAG